MSRISSVRDGSDFCRRSAACSVMEKVSVSCDSVTGMSVRMCWSSTANAVYLCSFSHIGVRVSVMAMSLSILRLLRMTEIKTRA